ncbi:hypothetical protein ABW19_dt0208962 [Dactylella cylindrospora]|nr:hypothetical protein ABW19_dt0208962 [Dactylella cylindrospora]
MNANRASRKPNNGCWTCRVRRKKCDEEHPKCSVCKTLGITCYFSNHKPEWMDGGVRQKEMVEALKVQIKDNARSRRERSVVSSDMRGSGPNQYNFVVGFDPPILDGPKTLVAPRVEDQASSDDVSMGSYESPSGEQWESPNTSGDTASTNPQSLTTPSMIGSICTPGSEPNALSLFGGALDDHYDLSMIFPNPLDYEVVFLSNYLDYVFPFLFPFYRPDIVTTGRSWLLFLLRKSKVAFHSALGLSAYFLSMKLSAAFPESEGGCRDQIWQKLLDQSHISLELVRKDIAALSHCREDAVMVEKIRIMQSIMHLLIFEMAVGQSAGWEIHLTAATTLFEDILRMVTPEPSEPLILSVLETMSKGCGCNVYGKRCIPFWTPDQNGFRFFTGFLVLTDIVGSVTMGREPRLLNYYPQILNDVEGDYPEKGEPTIRISTITGCQNWALKAVSKISALDVWKKKEAHAGTFSMIEMALRVADISRDINENLKQLDDSKNSEQIHVNAYDYNILPSTTSVVTGKVTKVWAHAAQIYLAVVVTGWQPWNVEIRRGVEQTLKLLQTMTCPAYLRTVAWPLCVAGCLAEGEATRRQFRELFTGTEWVETLGALGEARRTIERVWQECESGSPANWDLLSCFHVLGHPVLLI